MADDGFSTWLRPIDLEFQGQPGCVSSYLLIGAGERVLVETGPSSTVPSLTRGIELAGVGWNDISRLIVTHIHLDHAGAAGVLMRDHPHLRLTVHPVGAPHVIDPSRLLASASRIYGDRMGVLWGEIAPIDADRVDVAADDEVLSVAGRRLRVAFTPGHASHHLVLYDEASGVLFTGDAAAVRAPGTSWVCPSPPPPEFDPVAWKASVARMRELKPSRLALTHFGLFDDVEAHLDQIEPGFAAFIAIARQRLAGGGSLGQLAEDLRAFTATAIGLERESMPLRQIETANPANMAAMGLHRYLRVRGDIEA